MLGPEQTFMPTFGTKPLSRLLIALVSLNLAQAASGETAAESDWSPDSTNQICRGTYPETTPQPSESQLSANQVSRNQVAAGQIKAEANSLLHVQDHSTSLVGDINIRHGDTQLEADFATIDAATDTYAADGQIKLRQPGLLLTGEQISGNLFSGNAAIDSASFLIHQNRIRGSAQRIEKSAANDLTITDGSFTTCEPDSNTWSVDGKSIELKSSEGYGVARDVTLRIKDLPVAYFPYLRFPIDDRRHSGFLLPSLGHDSDGGTDIALPYYFNLAPDYDATYTLRSLWKRGLMHEGELRNLNAYGETTVAAAYLANDDEYDDRTQVDINNPDEFDEQDRWLTHLNHRGRKGRFSSIVNYTSVSDIDYLHDLGGFTTTESQFDQALDTSHSPAILRTGSLSHAAKYWRSRLELRSFQQLNQLRPEQYELLPRLSIIGERQFGILSTSALIQFTEFDSALDTEPVGGRSVLDAKVSIPFRKPWGFVEPAVRVIHRDYNLDETSIGSRDDARITTTLASIDSGLIFERNFREGYIQTLEPRIQYLSVEEEFQADLPSFDSTPITPSYDALFRDIRYTGYDRIGDANRFAIGITSNIYSASSGRSILEASLGQLVHLDDREVNFGNTPGVDPTNDSSPVFTRITANFKNLQISGAYEFDTQSHRSNRGYIGLKYRGPNQAIFNINYAMTDKSVQRNRQLRNEEETDISLSWPISPKWQIIGRWNYGWDRSQTIESLFGVEYNDCCWKARVVFRRNLDEPRVIALTSTGQPTQLLVDRRADSGIYFEFLLKGLGSLGGRLDSLLRDSIAGYSTDRDR